MTGSHCLLLQRSPQLDNAQRICQAVQPCPYIEVEERRGLWHKEPVRQTSLVLTQEGRREEVHGHPLTRLWPEAEIKVSLCNFSKKGYHIVSDLEGHRGLGAAATTFGTLEQQDKRSTSQPI